jgi:hypothetical protein
VCYALALLAGLLAGFFLVFNSVFSDVIDTGERLFSFILIILVYGALGVVLGYLAASWPVGLVLAAPAVLFVAWYTLREPGNPPLHLAYIVVTATSACLSSYLGERIATRAKTPANR